MDLSDLLAKVFERLGKWLCFVLTRDYSFLAYEVLGVCLLDIILFMVIIAAVKWLFRGKRSKPLFRL
jgi:hypothetical protein